MVKFSIDGDDDGEGPSNPRQKRQRISVLLGTAGEDVEEQSGTAEEELEGEESEQEQEGMQSEENDDPTFVNNDDGTPLSIRLRSNNSGREDAVSMMNDDDTPLGIRLRSINSGTENAVSVIKGRGKYVSVFLTEPEVLDCFICYEPLSIPVFQCENEHTACRSCCVKIGNKCPMCSMPIGYNRCRAIEKNWLPTAIWRRASGE
ncbi:hypothetical protein L6164_016894 [Bauhinia variegata]|uniref:Uncharacterized protein n=1 Tax=Bauhinia variegata TaxID=167791 RepID=A0ACB9N6Y5_BAUVA|nr:hypothetical protein L6164_016894 [Bauhinia variegata]